MIIDTEFKKKLEELTDLVFQYEDEILVYRGMIGHAEIINCWFNSEHVKFVYMVDGMFFTDEISYSELYNVIGGMV